MNSFRDIQQELPKQYAWSLDSSLFEQVEQLRSHRNNIVFVYPRNTEAVACQANCQLNCAHCGGHYLQKMTEVGSEKPERPSLLVSGGCDRLGRVPWDDHFDYLRQVRKRQRINLHTGLVDGERAAKAAAVADVVSFDFVYDDEAIRQVYGLPFSGDDYLQAYRQLRAQVKVIPHICIGLMGGRLQGEWEALQILAEEGVEGIAFIVFTPTPGTRFAERQPPPLGETVELLARARLLFPRIPLHLGCMRPKGSYRLWLDLFSVAIGLDRIVQPTHLARRFCADMKWDIQIDEECCVL